MDNKEGLLKTLIVLNTILILLIIFLLLTNQGIINLKSVEDSSDINQSQNQESDENQGLEETEEANPLEITVYYFDRDKFDIPDNTDYLTAVSRSTTRKDVATYSIEQIVSGPLVDEQNQYNLGDTFGESSFVEFVGNSNCDGKDFTVRISNGRATVQFCKETLLSGDMSGSIVEEQIRRTLKQFSTIDEVQILNIDGNCFNDMAGFTPEECIF
jgi:hypothetical protein